MKKAIIVQARMGSTRLPGKVLLPMTHDCALGVLLTRLAKVRHADEIIVATSTLSQDDAIEHFCKARGVLIFRGDEKDVLARYYGADQLVNASVIVRVTADCPLFDYHILDAMLEEFDPQTMDYMSNIHPRSFPKGLDTEIFTRSVLIRAFAETQTVFEREHVTPYFYQTPGFRVRNYSSSVDLSAHRWTLDYPEDYYFLRRVYAHLPEPTCDHTEVLQIILQTPELRELSESLNNKSW